MTRKVLEDYQQGAQYISSEEADDIVEIIQNEGQHFPFESGDLYRGVCLGKTHEVGDIIEVSKNVFESWTEDINIAEEFSKERGSEISAVYMLREGQIKGLMLENYSHEMEWLLVRGEYIVGEIEELEDYTIYYVKRIF